MAALVQISNSHEVGSWLRDQILAGTLKSCVHLKIIQAYREQQIVFIPNCARRSFAWKGNAPRDDTEERQVLCYQLHTNPISCPAGCLNFASTHKANLSLKLSKLWSLVSYLARPFQWFAKLPWQTQLGLIAVLILLFAPRWVPQVVNLLNAFHGK